MWLSHVQLVSAVWLAICLGFVLGALWSARRD
jgi:hypothetical protein